MNETPQQIPGTPQQPIQQQPQQQVPPQQPITPPQQMMGEPKVKFPWLLAIVVILAITGYFGASYLLNIGLFQEEIVMEEPSPTPRDTLDPNIPEGWVNFNTTQGYKFSHPKDWIIEDTGNFIRLSSPEAAASSIEGGGHSATISLQDTNISNTEKLIMEVNKLPENCRQDLQVLDIGRKAVRYVACDFASPTTVEWIESGKKVSVGILVDVDEVIEILSTLEFIEPAPPTLSFFDIEVGTKMGFMTVVSIRPAHENVTGPGPFGYIIKLEGSLTLTGQYTPLMPNNPLSFTPRLSDLSTNSLMRIPRLKEDTRKVWFAFSNHEDVAQMLGDQSGTATVTISSYEIHMLESAVANRAIFVSGSLAE